MPDAISFQTDIDELERQLEKARADLETLEAKYRTYNLKTEECRRSLEAVRSTLEGRLPEGRRDGGHGDEISQVEVNPESGRPSRGARREQLEQICRKIGASGEPFRTKDVLNFLQDIEGELTEGMKSYTYAVMTTLQEDDIVEKVGRGRWVLKT
jgi:chromosome segregation ATPase